MAGHSTGDLRAAGLSAADFKAADFTAAVWAAIDAKTKPQGALGRIETLAAQIAHVQNSLSPRLDRGCLMIFAADHGLTREGVSAYPSDVTRQMVLNFATGGAAANVFTRVTGLDLQVVNAGVRGGPFGIDAVRDMALGEGTENTLHAPAMSEAVCEAALDSGARLGAEGHWDAMAFGEMGIGNTSAATLIAHRLLGVAISELVGPGTGLDGPGVARKREVLEAVSARVEGALGPREVLRQFGGFEIAMMAGAMTGAARARRVVLVDGFIAGAAALVAVRLDPGVRAAMVFTHRSAEPGHDAILAALGGEPLLDLGMRLGEGTGAALAWPLVRAAAAMLSEMASFDQAGVSGPT